MIYKTYGNTGIKVSAIGFGGMRFDDEDVKAGRLEKCAEVALYAHDKGINYFDAAPMYCQDKSEEITGLAVSQMKRDSVLVSTKMNLGTLNRVATKEAYRERLEMSLTRLKVDYIDFYHLWCILNPKSYEKSVDALYDFFVEAKKDGLIKNIVFSSHMQGDELESVIGDGRFAGVLIGYNALNYQFRFKGVQAAAEHGMGVVAMNPLGGGMIPQNPEFFKYLTEGTDLTVAQAGLRFVASHKEISIALCGISCKEQVDDAVKSVEGLVQKPAAEIAKQYADSGLHLNNLCTGCGYCKDCPSNIDIPKFMDAYNHQILGMNVGDRLAWHWGMKADKAKDCIACGKCEAICTQHLPIIERLKEIAAK